MRQRLYDGNRTDVERVAIGPLEGTNAALAQDDVEVAAPRDVLRGHQPLFDRRLKPTFQHDGLVDLADGLQQPEVLHVSGTDLQHVGVLHNNIDVMRVDDLRDERKPDLLARGREYFEALLTES